MRPSPASRLSAGLCEDRPDRQTLVDNVTLIRFLEKSSDHSNIVGIAMGDAGIISRVLALRSGGAFTFAAASLGAETAPGQIDARTLLETYRIDPGGCGPPRSMAWVGNPVKNSLSPIMLNTAFRRETVNAVYLGLQTTKLADLLRLVHEIPIQGLSVTMPFKQEIIPFLERTDPLTTKIGACNTVLRAPDGKLYGFNTDVAGIVGPLEKRLPLRGAKVLVLGGGRRCAGERPSGLKRQVAPRSSSSIAPPKLRPSSPGRQAPRPSNERLWQRRPLM